MATYEYECPGGERVIIERSIHEAESNYMCSVCGGKMIRVYTAPPVKFNGTGFYSTGGQYG